MGPHLLAGPSPEDCNLIRQGSALTVLPLALAARIPYRADHISLPGLAASNYSYRLTVAATIIIPGFKP